MKSFKKLISFNNHKTKEKRDSIASLSSLDARPVLGEDPTQLEVLREMRTQYEGLSAVSSLVSSRAADFSAAIQELADYFIRTFGSLEDGEMSKVFKIVGRVQFEVSKVLEIYVTHVSQTITEPTQTLLSEIRNMQESKTQHDEKRQLYENLRARITRGRPKSAKGDTFADQQLQIVKDEFDKLSVFINARLESLAQGQARSLITQAARHHSAQMSLFSRGHSSLQAVEPYMRQVARERCIDRQLSAGINGVHEMDDDSDSKSDVSYIDEVDNSSDSQSLGQSNRWVHREDSPERSPNKHDEEPDVPKNLSKEWSSLMSKLNHNGETSHRRSGELARPSTPNVASKQGGVLDSTRSHSGRPVAPSPHTVALDDEAIHITELPDEPKSAHSVELPFSPPGRPPPEVPSGSSRAYDGVSFRTSSDLSSVSVSTSGRTSVDEPPADIFQGDGFGLPLKFGQHADSVETFQAKVSASTPKRAGSMPPRPAGKPPVLSFVSPSLSSTPAGLTRNAQNSSLYMKRYSQSGPLTFSGSPWAGQPSMGNVHSSPSKSTNLSDVHKSGPLGRSPLSRTFGSPRISPTISPPAVSPPRISELHKLPPPPLNPVTTKSKSPPSPPTIAHSEPLSKHLEQGKSNFVQAIPLPPPPLGSVSRSLSLPSRHRHERTRTSTISQLPEVDEEVNPTPTYMRSPTNSVSSSRSTGSKLSSKARGSHKRVASGNVLGQETGCPPSDLKFVHYNPTKSAGSTPSWGSQYRKPPSPSSSSSIDRAQQYPDGGRADAGPSYYTSPVLRSSGSLHSPRWRSLSITDRDDYINSIARRAAAIKRDFQPEMVPLNHS